MGKLAWRDTYRSRYPTGTVIFQPAAFSQSPHRRLEQNRRKPYLLRTEDREALQSSFGEYGPSCGLRVSLCTLQLTCSVFTSSVAVATLGRSGWLDRTPQGLSPYKKRQASLGAPAISGQLLNQDGEHAFDFHGLS